MATQSESMAATRRGSSWKLLAVHGQSSMWRRETGQSHNNAGFVGLEISVTIKNLTMAIPPPALILMNPVALTVRWDAGG